MRAAFAFMSRSHPVMPKPWSAEQTCRFYLFGSFACRFVSGCFPPPHTLEDTNNNQPDPRFPQTGQALRFRIVTVASRHAT